MFFDWVKSGFRGHIFVDDAEDNEKAKDAGLFGFMKKEDEIYSTIKFPQAISVMSKNSIREIIRHDISTYRHLKYPSQDESVLQKLEWHNWQVSFMMRAVKEKIDVVVHYKEEVFVSDILSLKPQESKSMAEHLMHKYVEVVDIAKPKEELRKEYQWSAFEVGILLFYISTLGTKH